MQIFRHLGFLLFFWLRYGRQNNGQNILNALEVIACIVCLCQSKHFTRRSNKLRTLWSVTTWLEAYKRNDLYLWYTFLDTTPPLISTRNLYFLKHVIMTPLSKKIDIPCISSTRVCNKRNEIFTITKVLPCEKGEIMGGLNV